MTGFQRWSKSFFSLMEAVVTRWGRDATHKPHDHGGACGLVLLLWGELLETKYQVVSGKLIPVKFARSRGPSIGFITKEEVHDLRCVKDAVAFHIYFPKPKDPKFY